MITNNYLSYTHKPASKVLARDGLLQKIENSSIDKPQKSKLDQQLGLMKLIRSKNTGHKRNKNKYREDAKFSSDSEQQPSYILTQYPSNTADNNSKTRDLFPLGSVLKLKTCNIVMHTNKGKVDLQVEVLTQQSHKTILNQLFDPAFSKLSIKKEKDQQQIIKYLNQSTKPYRYLVCWFQALQSHKNHFLKQISLETNERKKIFGWQDEHIKLHIMSMRQLKQIRRFKCPQKVTSKQATYLSEDKLLMIMQYPEKIQEIRQLYKPFTQIEQIKSVYQAYKPFCEGETALDRMIVTNQLTTQRPIYHNVIHQGWDDQPIIKQTQIVQNNQEKKQVEPLVVSKSPKDKIQSIRLHFGFGQFEEILTDEDQKGQQTKDLATELLNSITTLPVINPPSIGQFANTANNNHQLYQGYHGGYDVKRTPYPENHTYWNYSFNQYQNPSQYEQSYYPNYHYPQPPQNQYIPYQQHSQKRQTFNPSINFYPRFDNKLRSHSNNNFKNQHNK